MPSKIRTDYTLSDLKAGGTLKWPNGVTYTIQRIECRTIHYTNGFYDMTVDCGLVLNELNMGDCLTYRDPE